MLLLLIYGRLLIRWIIHFVVTITGQNVFWVSPFKVPVSLPCTPEVTCGVETSRRCTYLLWPAWSFLSPFTPSEDWILLCITGFFVVEDFSIMSIRLLSSLCYTFYSICMSYFIVKDIFSSVSKTYSRRKYCTMSLFTWGSEPNLKVF